MIIIICKCYEVGNLFLKYGYIVTDVVDHYFKEGMIPEEMVDDCLSVGKITMIEAIETYNPEGVLSLKKYIRKKIKKDIKEMIREQTEYHSFDVYEE